MSNSPTKRKNNAELTRQKIMNSAVKHFGAHGFQGASLRAIVRDADANIAAANYHFESKSKLYFTVIESYFERTRDKRLKYMEEAEKIPIGRERLKALINGYIYPHIDLVIGQKQHDYGRLITQLLNDNEIVTNEIFAREVDKVRLPFKDKLQTCCPHVSEDVLALGIGFVVAIMAQTPFDPSYRTLTNTSPLEKSVATINEGTVTFAHGGLCALFGLDD